MAQDGNAAEKALEETKGAFEIVIDQAMGMWQTFLAALPTMVVAVVVLIITWILSKILLKVVTKIMDSTPGRQSLTVLMRKITSILVWSIGIITAAVVVFPSVTPGKMLTALGLGGVAIGFAFKDVFENFLAGMLILLREPFKLDDFIECEDYEGWVEEITIRDTRLRQPDGQPVVMPNAMLFQNPVTVRTAKNIRRVSLSCGVAYSEDLVQSQQVILEAVNSVESVHKDKDVQVYAEEFGDSSINFDIKWWTDSEPRAVRTSTHDVIVAVKKALDDAGIEIPFPYRTLTFNEPLSLRGRDRDEDDSEASDD